MGSINFRKITTSPERKGIETSWTEIRIGKNLVGDPKRIGGPHEREESPIKVSTTIQIKLTPF